MTGKRYRWQANWERHPDGSLAPQVSNRPTVARKMPCGLFTLSELTYPRR